MSDLVDPFDDDEVSRIINDTLGDQFVGAIADAQRELDDVAVAISALAARLRELVAPSAVVNIVTSLAVGTVVRDTYE